jgi:hypothetical protein
MATTDKFSGENKSNYTIHTIDVLRFLCHTKSNPRNITTGRVGKTSVAYQKQK